MISSIIKRRSPSGVHRSDVDHNSKIQFGTAVPLLIQLGLLHLELGVHYELRLLNHPLQQLLLGRPASLIPDGDQPISHFN